MIWLHGIHGISQKYIHFNELFYDIEVNTSDLDCLLVAQRNLKWYKSGVRTCIFPFPCNAVNLYTTFLITSQMSFSGATHNILFKWWTKLFFCSEIKYDLYFLSFFFYKTKNTYREITYLVEFSKVGKFMSNNSFIF